MAPDHTPDESIHYPRETQEPYVGNKQSTNSYHLAKHYLTDRVTYYGISKSALALEKSPTDTITDDGTELRFSGVTSLMQTDIVSFVQTHFGLPIWGAEISVSIQKNPLRVTISQSTIHPTVDIKQPAADAKYLTTPITRDVFTNLLDVIVPSSLFDIRNEWGGPARLFIFQYQRSTRFATSRGDSCTTDSTLNVNLATIRLWEIPDEIQNGKHYVVREVLFTTKPQNSRAVTWRAFIEVETGTILYLQSLGTTFTGRVFPTDPPTYAGNKKVKASCSNAVLMDCTKLVELLGIRVCDPGEPQLLKGEYIELADLVLPHPPTTIASAPGEFNFGPKTDTSDFSAVNAYYHCDAAFRMIKNLGFDVNRYFRGTTFPVMVDAHAKVPSMNDPCAFGDCVDASTIATKGGNGLKAFLFARICASEGMSLATDRRAVLHEFGHALLLNLIGSPTLGFAHNGGDSLAAIRCDPESNLKGMDRFETFPFIDVELEYERRRHDREVSEGWSWGGPHDDQNYKSEQILSTTLFRAYLAAGGNAEDSNDKTQLARRRPASGYLIYLIVRAMGSLPPHSTNPVLTPRYFERHLIQADKAKPDFEGRPSGNFHKVISWAFEKQGLVHENGGKNCCGEGIPNVDVYIDDRRNGEYDYQENFWSSPGIWNRYQPDADDTHQRPILNRMNFVYVRVKNRGAHAAKEVRVSVYHTASTAELVWGDGWIQMTTYAKMPANPIMPGDCHVLGPFEWTPTSVEESLLAIVTTPDDLSNVDPTPDSPHRNDQTPLRQLVPFDNNVALRNVGPVPGGGGNTTEESVSSQQ